MSSIFTCFESLSKQKGQNMSQNKENIAKNTKKRFVFKQNLDLKML